jgi:very-short-patch-repair endonuclease
MKRNYKYIENIINNRLKEANATLIEPFLYRNNKSKLKLRCNIDNHEWSVTYYCFINIKNGCPRCAGQVIYEKEAIEKVKNRTKEINASLRETFIYNGSSTRIKLKCNLDNYEWETTYSNFINSKTGCFKCSKHVLFKDEIEKNINRRLKEVNASLRKPYIHENNKSKIKLRCNVDGHEWDATYINFINNNKGCAYCAKVLKLTQSDAEKRVEKQCEKMRCKLLKPFIYSKTSTTEIILKCDICGYEWSVIYNNFMSRESGCPSCKESRGEKIISEILNDKNIKHSRQKKFENCKFLSHLPFDFYLPDYNICIEYDGIQHFKSFDFFGGNEKLIERQKKDKIKDDYCLKNKINLIRISYNDINNIENILNNYLRNS